MSKVVLSLGHGNLQNGFPAVTAELWQANSTPSMKFKGSLPAAPEISSLYKDWQLQYAASYQCLDLLPRLELLDFPEDVPDEAGFSYERFNDLCQQFSDSINAWLNSGQFRNINERLRTKLDDSEEIRLIIETDDKLLRRIPWHLWNFFEDYPKAEVALCAPEYKSTNTRQTKKPGDKVRILAIFGDSKGINIEQDRSVLEKLADAEVKFLVEPDRSQLNDQLWAKPWDILFFAGHSSSFSDGESGRIYINQTRSLTISELKHALKNAIAGGLKLAIFNSCDGLGLAQALFDLHIPQTIVMREPVPDAIAQAFLEYFLAAFSGGESLYTAVREARQRLHGLEEVCPCASWLPAIFQNPAEVPPTWKDLLPIPPCPPMPWGGWKGKLLVASLMVTGLVMGVRHLGMLQKWELQAFDSLMQLRSIESQDPRLLIVTIDEADIQYQIRQKMKMRWSLSDEGLAQLLKKLEQYQPRTIGIDIYRDFSVEPDFPDLAKRLRQDERLFATCKVSAPEDGAPDGNPPPPEVPKERLGFSDFVADDDDVARRHLLHLTPPLTSPCAADNALNLQIALHYLKAQGIEPKITQQRELQLGNVVFNKLKSQSGGYQRVDAAGYQILLNYRSLRSLRNIAPQISLRDILNNRINPELRKSVKNRIVFIGVIAPTTADQWKTPFSLNAPQNQTLTPGVFVQAQMVSQILSAVLDRRPLLWWWPEWVEVFWVWGWGLLGGMLALCIRQPLMLGLAGTVSLGMLFTICFVIFTAAGWVPFVPSALALLATEVVLVWWSTRSSNFVHRSRPWDVESWLERILFLRK
ncbi:MAG TPA: transmembrane sensor domain-containing protein [Cyanobacteria bacterium UBA11372]|nr:transmembrane sensor domain-containing protein [Cyanobacteria bacterium UBA11372]